MPGNQNGHKGFNPLVIFRPFFSWLWEKEEQVDSGSLSIVDDQQVIDEVAPDEDETPNGDDG